MTADDHEVADQAPHTEPIEEDNRVHIFDTTLRDGEQSPGISLNTQEKVEIATQLARLGVDVIEAGFPITSPGDCSPSLSVVSKMSTRLASVTCWPLIGPSSFSCELR